MGAAPSESLGMHVLLLAHRGINRLAPVAECKIAIPQRNKYFNRRTYEIEY